MITIKRTFQELKIKGYKSGVCGKCGKKTQNPFNKNKDGVIKDRDEIFYELRLERDEWLKKPLYHAKCED